MPATYCHTITYDSLTTIPRTRRFNESNEEIFPMQSDGTLHDNSSNNINQNVEHKV